MKKNKKTYARCIRCGEKATYISPKNYCTFHWVKWWFSGYKRDEILTQVADMLDGKDKELFDNGKA